MGVVVARGGVDPIEQELAFDAVARVDDVEAVGGVRGRDQVPELIQLYMDGKLDVDPFVSHSITLDEVNKGFDLMEAQDGIRSVIAFA